MRLRQLLVEGCASAALVLFAIPGAAATDQECVAGQPSGAAYTLNFDAEANGIFENIRMEARRVVDHADKLQTFARNPQISWQGDADQMARLRREINDMGRKLCRLETIRDMLSPWQQSEIDRINTAVRLVAADTEDAIAFCNAHQSDLALPTYWRDTDNLYHAARVLSKSAKNAVAYASASHDRQLRKKVSAPAAS
jgi:hypothetical protein